jgi:hypothetical protein
MKKFSIITNGLAAFFLFALVSTASAGVGTEAGNWEYNFDSPETKADVAARNFHYDQDSLAQIGTEAGNWEYRYETPGTATDMTAQNYKYDQESLSRIGTEAGDWEYKFDSTSASNNEAVAEKGLLKDAVCNGC